MKTTKLGDRVWAIMTPERARALEAVAKRLRSAERHAWHDPVAMEQALERAFSALDRLSAARVSQRERGGR